MIPKIKICGLSRDCDVDYANEVMPEFVGFVFAANSKRYIAPEKAAVLKWKLDYRIAATGVFVNEKAENVAELAQHDVIDIIQLHGSENSSYIEKLRTLTDVPIIQAFKITSEADIEAAKKSTADFILLDSGSGSGKTFDHSLIKNISRPFFLAGGITPENAGEIAEKYSPYAIDASSSLETNGFKDLEKMKIFVDSIRNRKD